MKRPYVMLLEENKALMRKAIEDLNEQKAPALAYDFVAHDFVDHTNQLRGPEEVKQLYTAIFKSFPDYHKTIENIIAEGDEV